ncbi:N4 gp68-like protein [Roseovarius Plymouth podovirus 1]|uniref:N4 gp68-like protein n=2 Tax=Roseovarius Plymouth podovirus 1 TaxID=926474 RepID=K4Q567_9CAUD|nr:N4 gp68-like protein [Roseovarius Plymouth podovirus 1]CBW47072.1 N4 gp68-like protein [Roseovarius sp. 217 phage 1]CBX88008.1 N4 gp68-like protein [Roseovarius Plymouth podovirus 1]
MSKFFGNKTVDDYLNEVDFDWLNNGGYIPSKFSLEFMNFIKLCNDGRGEDNKTPTMHLAMLDKLPTRHKKITNLCARGTAKTTLMAEYLTLYLAMFNKIPGFGAVPGMLYISDSMDNGVKSMRESVKSRYYSSEFLQSWLPEEGVRFTENYMEFHNKNGGKFGVKMFGAKSGIRGTKIFNRRPVLAVMDDLISDADSKSPTAMEAINDTVYSGVQYALDPTRHKMILNGTPFNKEDIVYQAIESGAWQVNVWPVCKEFPCEEKDFSGAWEDRFTYDYVKEMYDSSVMEGKEKSFRQELMLRITSDESRLIQESEIGWRSRQEILQKRKDYNFYITTDFATSSKQTADYTVISVWAYDKDGHWTWVDGLCERQQMDRTINDLFNFAQEYQPQGVGIEVTGQQGGFIPWIMAEMDRRGIYFNLTHDPKTNKPGIRPMTDKLSRFNLIVPYFKAGKVHFPSELSQTKTVGLFMEQISLATRDGLMGKDDCLDTISMLTVMNPWKPNPEEPQAESQVSTDDTIWGTEAEIDQEVGIDAYVV